MDIRQAWKLCVLGWVISPLSQVSSFAERDVSPSFLLVWVT